MFTILLPLDGSPLAEQAVPAAAAIAKDLEGAIELLLVQVENPLARHATSGVIQQPRTTAEEYLQRVADRIAASGVPPANVTFAALPGEEVDVICRRAKQRGAQLIVMTTHGRTGFSRLWLGSVADGVVRKSAVPVLLLRAREASEAAPRVPPRDFLIPVDGSKLAEQVIDRVLDEAADTASKLTLFQVVRPVPQVVADPNVGYAVVSTAIVDDGATEAARSLAERYVTELAGRVRARRPRLFVETRVIVAEAVAQAIIAAADAVQADAIAMTTHGRGASRLIVGSTADKVLRGAAVPLLVYRPRVRAPRVLRRVRRQRA